MASGNGSCDFPANQGNDEINDYNRKSEHMSKTDFIESFNAKRSKTFFDDGLDEEHSDSNIQPTIDYGNLTKNYDPIHSITKTKFDPNNLVNEKVVMEEDDEYSYQVYCSLFQNKNNKKLSSPKNKSSLPSSDEINLIRKSSLLKLIEKNRANQICCPFDEVAYSMLTIEMNTKHDTQIEVITMRRENMKRSHLEKLNNFEYINFKPIENSIDYFIPNCISTFLMNFFMDIFPPSELKMLSEKTLEIILKLKSLFKPQIHLNSELKTAYVCEDILWNCFAIFKFKFDKSYSIGFVNYLNSLFGIINAYKRDKCFEKNKFENSIRILVPYFIEALILNGYLDLNILKSFEKFVRLQRDYSLNEMYCIIEKKLQVNFPMKLNNMCRIVVKNSIKEFNAKSVQTLNVDNPVKDFILFNQEFESYYNETKYLFEI